MHEDSSIDIVQSVVDTGAILTCYTAGSLRNLKDINSIKMHKCRNIRGFGGEEVNSVKIYNYNVSNFILGSLNIGEQSIWLTFDERVEDNVLGMDILSQVSFLQRQKDNVMLFCKDDNELFEHAFGKTIVRRVHKDRSKDLYYVIYDIGYFYFNKQKIKFEQNLPYIKIGMVKCFLKW